MPSLLLAAGDPSKVPFYIAGGVLAVYAVALAAVGLTHPSFPGKGNGGRAVMALSFLVMAAAVAMAIVTDK
ncbi:MAG TPA: hypothetical protein VLP43_12480 [Solirubrobacteraceae bacterium]|nr:hypothetical protein [Solirubrobacteraceae bacterium]